MMDEGIGTGTRHGHKAVKAQVSPARGSSLGPRRLGDLMDLMDDEMDDG